MNNQVLIANLSMYDWPEVSADIDYLWNRWQAELAHLGYNAPKILTREDIASHWHSDNALLSQTCGLPFMRSLQPVAEIVGTLNYDVPYFTNGYYCSPILVRNNESRTELAEFKDCIVGVNALDSQSGFNALRNTLIAEDLVSDNAPFFKSLLLTGGHRSSIQALDSGICDVCSVDPVSWALAQVHEPSAQAVKVLHTTDLTPGLPLITSKHLLHGELDKNRWQSDLRDSLRKALDERIEANLFLTDLVQIQEADYLAVSDINIPISRT